MPLHHQPKPLSQAQQESLRALLLSPDIKLLEQVVEAHALEHVVKACGAFGESGKFPGKTDVGVGHLQNAHKYEAFLQVLHEVQQEKAHATATVTMTKP